MFLPQRDISWKLFGINGAVCWERPHVGWVKCNVDAVVFSSQSKISFGCLVRNSDGTFLAAKCDSFAGGFRARRSRSVWSSGGA